MIQLTKVKLEALNKFWSNLKYIIYIFTPLFFTSLKRCSFGADLAKIKHINMIMCQLTTKINHVSELLTEPNFRV